MLAVVDVYRVRLIDGDDDEQVGDNNNNINNNTANTSDKDISLVDEGLQQVVPKLKKRRRRLEPAAQLIDNAQINKVIIIDGWPGRLFYDSDLCCCAV